MFRIHSFRTLWGTKSSINNGHRRTKYLLVVVENAHGGVFV